MNGLSGGSTTAADRNVISGNSGAGVTQSAGSGNVVQGNYIGVLADGITPAPAVNSHPKVSANGRVVVFDTLAGAAFGALPADGRQVAVLAGGMEAWHQAGLKTNRQKIFDDFAAAAAPPRRWSLTVPVLMIVRSKASAAMWRCSSGVSSSLVWLRPAMELLIQHSRESANTAVRESDLNYVRTVTDSGHKSLEDVLTRLEETGVSLEVVYDEV